MPYFMTMGLMSIFVSLGTAYSLAKSYKLDGLTSAMLSLMAFLLVAAPQVKNAMSMEFLGGQGVFTAIICALWSVELIHFLKKYNITLRMPEQVPPAIARSFELLYPVIGIMLTVYPVSLLLQSQYGILLPAAIMHVFQPLVAMGIPCQQSYLPSSLPICCGLPVFMATILSPDYSIQFSWLIWQPMRHSSLRA